MQMPWTNSVVGSYSRECGWYHIVLYRGNIPYSEKLPKTSKLRCFLFDLHHLRSLCWWVACCSKMMNV